VERTSVCTGVLRRDLLVDDPFDLRELLLGERGEVDEVEPQAVGRDERARLLHVRSQHLAQRRVQQVRGRVVAARRVAHLIVHLGGDQVSPVADRPCSHGDLVQRGPAGATPHTPRPGPRARPSSVSVPVSDTWPPAST
jgi:hypothetical protein